VELVVVHKYRFNESTTDQELYGIYGTGPAHFLPVNLDLYWLGVDNPGVTFNGTSGREQRQTLGGRVWGKTGKSGLDFEVQGAAQFGTVGDGDIAAWMITGKLGYTLPAPRLSPHVYLEFDYASGDSRPGGNVGTFNQLFLSAHGFLGYIDYVGRRNIISPNAGLTITPVRDLTLSLQQYFFWRASDRDALYNTAGAVSRPGTGTTARYIGAEIDLLATYNVTYHVQVYAGYNHFFAGEFIRQTGPSKDSDFFYAAAE
jgi:Alginate export